MAREDIPESERLLELQPGMGVWKIHLDRLRERDVNARVMDDAKFRRLSENIKGEGELESFPLVAKVKDKDDFTIISGHHRTRAARAAGLMIVPCIVIEREMTEDEITSKQLSHNSLEGYDNQDLLQQMYDSIKSIDAKLASGLTDLEVEPEEAPVPTDALDFEFDFEPVYILFMTTGSQRFEKMLERLESDAKVYAADKADFERYVNMVNTVSKKENVRNIAGIIMAIMDIVDAHYKGKKS